MFLNIPNIKKANWKRPAKKTAQDNICPFVSKISPKQNINIIKVRFKSIGDAAPIANLLKEVSQTQKIDIKILIQNFIPDLEFNN